MLCFGRASSHKQSVWLRQTSPEAPTKYSSRLAHGFVRRRGNTDSHFMNNNRFNRQILMFGEAGQEQIEKQIVGIAGSGGLGSQIGQSLAYLGVRNFGIIDDDRLDDTNMNREAGAFPPDVWRIKVE